MNHDPREILSTRLIDATREQVFAAWRDPQRLKRWFGPNGFTSTFKQFDFRSGGDWKFTFHGPDGKDYENEFVFREVAEPSRIVIEHNSQPHFLLESLHEDVDGRTRITWHQRFDTPEVRDKLASICVPANEQNFDRLEAELKRGG